MIEILKTFFGNSVSAVEAFCGLVSVGSIITLIGSIFFIVYKGKKFDKGIEQINKETKEEINAFKEQHKQELEALKTNLTKDLDNIINMIMLEASKSGVDMDKFNQIVELYKKVIKDEILDTDKLETEKAEQVEQEELKQDSVKQNIENIDKVLNDLV